MVLSLDFHVEPRDARTRRAGRRSSRRGLRSPRSWPPSRSVLAETLVAVGRRGVGVCYDTGVM